MADRSNSSGGGSAGPTHRLPPHNLEAERSLLGAMLLRSDAVAAAVEVIGANDFFKPSHAHVFDAITNLYAQGSPIDAVTVAEELRRANLLESVGGLALLYDVQASTPAISNAAHYARIVEENALLRNLISVAGDIAEIGYGLPDDVAKAIDQAESMVFQIADKRVADTTRSLHELLGGTLDHLE
jgi:replicative DNA helicase